MDPHKHSSKNTAPLAVWNTGSPQSNNETSVDIDVRMSGCSDDKGSCSSSGLGGSRGSTETLRYSPDISLFDDDPKFYEISETSMRTDENQRNGYMTHPAYEGVKFTDDVDSKCDSFYSSDDEEDNAGGKKTKVPDGGWGWVVVFSSFFISMVADGTSFSFGLLYIEFLNHFGQTKSKTSWIGSLFMSVPLLSGPIMSALVDRYGCKWMTILGGFISGVGFVVATFGNTIEWEYVWFGVVAGIGLGLCYVTAVVSIAFWFDKKRTLATSLGACGTGIGTFVYAPMTQYFIDTYGWRGTVLLLAGTFFNICVCGAVMRDPEWIIEEHSKQASLAGSKSVRNVSSVGSVSGGEESQFPGPEEIRKLMKSGRTPEYILTALATSVGTDDKDLPVKSAFRSVLNLPTYLRQSETVPLEVLEHLSSNKRIYKVILESYPSLLYYRSNSVQNKMQKLPVDNRVPVTMSMKLKAAKKNPTSPIKEIAIEPCMIPLLTKIESPTIVTSPTNYKTTKIRSPNWTQKESPWTRQQHSLKEMGVHHYLKDIRVHRNSVMYRGATLHLPRYRLRASSCPNIYRNSMTTIAKENQEKWYADLMELFKDMFDFSMFLELHFLLMSLATILLFIWFIVPYFYLAEHLTRHDYTEAEASSLLSWIGITNTIGMVSLGWAGDQPWMNVQKTYSVCLVLCGVSTILMPIATDSYLLLAATCGSFGLFFASNYSFTPTILVELIPLERFTTSYGLMLLCQGIGNLLGPPLAGWLFDLTGTWDLSFFMAGTWIIVAGLLVALIPVTKNKKIFGSGLLEMDRISNV